MASYTVVFFFLRSLLSLTLGTRRLEHRIWLCVHRTVYIVYTWILDHFVKIHAIFFLGCCCCCVHVHAQNSSEGANSLSLKMLKNGKEREIRLSEKGKWKRCGWNTYVHMLQRFSRVASGENETKNGLRCQHTYSLLYESIQMRVSSDWSSRGWNEHVCIWQQRRCTYSKFRLDIFRSLFSSLHSTWSCM